MDKVVDILEIILSFILLVIIIVISIPLLILFVLLIPFGLLADAIAESTRYR